MANAFKLKTATGTSTNADTAITVYTAPSATTSICLGLNISNLLTSNVVVDVQIENNDGDNVYIVKDVLIENGSALELMTGNKIVLETSDVLKVTSNAANSIDCSLSVMEQT